MSRQNGYSQASQRLGAEADDESTWTDTRNLAGRGANVNALDLVARIDALRDHVADLARAPQPLPPPIARDAERALVGVVLTGAELRWQNALDASLYVIAGPAIDAAADPTYALALRCARRIYRRQCRWSPMAITQDAWDAEHVAAPWLLEELEAIALEAINVCDVDAHVDAVLRADRLRRVLALSERISAACRTHNEHDATELALELAKLVQP